MADMIPLSNDVTPANYADSPSMGSARPVKRVSLVHGKGDIRLGALYTSAYTDNSKGQNLGPVTEIKGKINKPGLTIIMGVAPVKWENLRDKNEFINLLIERIANQSY